MPSLSFHGGTGARASGGQLGRVLDPAFGFFVWAVHLLLIYGGTGLACTLGLPAAGGESRGMLLLALGVLTVLAAMVVAAHGVYRYRRMQDAPDPRFRAWIAVGGDAIALVAILWQFFPIWLLPVCA